MPSPPRILPFLIVGYALASLLTLDMYLPAMPALEDVFGTTAGQVQLTMTVYLAGFAISQFVYGPLSDRFGRRPVMLLGGLGFVAATLLCALSVVVEMLILARFAQGLMIGSLTVTTRATLRELYEEKRGTQLLAYISMAEGLSLALGPIIGAEIFEAFGWRWIFYVVAIVAGAALIGLFLMLPESNRQKNRDATRLGPLFQTYGRLIVARGFIGYVLPGGLAFAGLMAYYTTGSFLLKDAAGLTPREFSQVQFGIVLVYLAGLLLSSRLIDRIGLRRLINLGLAIILVGSLTMLGLAIAGVGGMWPIAAPFAAYGFGIGTAMAPLITKAMSVNPAATGTVAALFGMLTMSVSFVGSLIAQLSYTGEAISLAIPVAALAVLAVISYIVVHPHE